MTPTQIDRRQAEKQVVWLVSREYNGLAGAGGVKDVCRQLAETLVGEEGLEVRVIMPRYGFMDPQILGFEPLSLTGTSSGVINGNRFEHCFSVDMDYIGERRREQTAIWFREIAGVTIFLVEGDRFGDKLGVYTYTKAEESETGWQKSGSGHYDYFAMNILLQKAALDLMILLGEVPWIIHCQDGHGAVLPAMIRELSGYRQYFRQTGVVVTVHNAGLGYHQEVDDLEFAEAVTGLPESVIKASLLDLAFDPFIAASSYAVLNTVSENYGRELQETSEDVRTGWLGHTLKKRGVKLKGVTNGIDPAAFDSRHPEELGLAAAFDVAGGELAGKRACKKALLAATSALSQWEHVEQFGTLLDDPDYPLFTFVGRLTEQKGVEYLIEGIENFFADNETAQLLILGSGNNEAEQRLQELSEASTVSGRLCFFKGFDPLLANKVYAAGDFFLIPSLYEPCGLTDYMAQLMGNLPIVHHVGGLVKVLDGQTGFAYTGNSYKGLAEAMERALVAYAGPAKIFDMQQKAVAEIHARHTWKTVKDEYLLLYDEARLLAPGNEERE